MPLLASAMLWALSAPAPAQTPKPQTPPAGEYVTEKGWGTLQVTSAAGKPTTFSLASIGGNMHSCQLEGDIVDGKASLEADEDQRCIVEFVPGADGIQVGGNDPCRYYCGARAGFEGLYLKVPEGCGGSAQQAARDTFKRLYDRKAYADARAALEPVLSRCGRILGWLDEGWIRNDLALVQHKLGDDRGCRATLAPLAADAAKSDDDIEGAYPPSDAEAYLPIVKATRFNLRLCQAKAP
ncbi:MAG: hypothetical protein U1E66_06665 [Rhodospirillales bacterium]